MPGWISWWEILILLAIILLIFGPKRLPELGRSMGRGAREFRDSIRGRHDRDEPAELKKPSELPQPQVEQRERDPVS